MLKTLSRITLRPKPLRQPISNGYGTTLASTNKLWLQNKRFSYPQAYITNTQYDIRYQYVYRDYVPGSHFVSWVPGIYKVSRMLNGGGGGGGDDWYLSCGEGGRGATEETVYVVALRGGVPTFRLSAQASGGGVRTDGQAGGDRRFGGNDQTYHLGGRGHPGIGEAYSPTPVGNGGAGGCNGKYPDYLGQPGQMGYTKIELIG